MPLYNLVNKFDLYRQWLHEIYIRLSQNRLLKA